MSFLHAKNGRRILSGIAATTTVAVIGVMGASAASAHGYIDGEVRARAATSQNVNRGSVQWEPQSLEAAKGFPGYGPSDGTIASAGGLFGGNLDAQSPTRWYKWPITTGTNTLRWKFTAPHRTAKFHYYMTKQGWDQNAPLSRSSLEQIANVPHNGTAASTNPAHEVVIPEDRSGYHVILAVWDVYDTGNAFYSVVDVNVTPGSGVVPDPEPNPDPEPGDGGTDPEPEPQPEPGDAWNPFGAYSVGDRVSYLGREYVCIQGYQGWGDRNWIDAPSLWTQLP